MRAGKLDRRVSLQQASRTQNGTGEVVDAWATTAMLWAGKRDVRAGERYGAQQVIAEVDTVFTFRWSPAFDTLTPDTHRLVYRGRVYNIHGITEIGRREGVEVACAARAEG